MKIKCCAVATALLAVPVASFLTTRIPSLSKHHISSATLCNRHDHDDRRQKPHKRGQWMSSCLFLSRNNNQRQGQQQQQYDLSKPVFDLYAGRQVRGDALAKYNTLNQSEPLRINLAAFGVLFFLALPALLEEVSRDGITSTTMSLTAALAGAASAMPSLSSSSSLPLAQMLTCYGSAVASAVVFWQQKGRRSRQLTRFERELQAVALSIRLPNNVLADRPYANAQTIRTLQQQSTTTLRLIAVSGNQHELRSALQELQVLSTRLVQSSTYVVVVATDGSRESDWGLVNSNDSNSSKQAWLVQPGDAEEWRSYFTSLSSSKNSSKDTSSSSSSLQWFVLSATGRSVGSGSGSNPSWLQLMGQHMRPTVLLDPSDATAIQTTTNTAGGAIQADILKHQERFYKALTSGNLKEMEAIFGKEDDESSNDYTETDAVTTVIKDGGRLDAWKACLEDGARPAGLVYGNADVTTIVDNDSSNVDIAYSTCVEFPAMEDMANAKMAAMTPTLLAVQKWSRRSSSSSSKSSSSSWKLVQHQTIPWTDDRPALGTLICDCRGCVSLVRGG